MLCLSFPLYRRLLSLEVAPPFWQVGSFFIAVPFHLLWEESVRAAESRRFLFIVLLHHLVYSSIPLLPSRDLYLNLKKLKYYKNNDVIVLLYFKNLSSVVFIIT